MWSAYSSALILAVLALNTSPLDANNQACLIQATIDHNLLKLLNTMNKSTGNVYGHYCMYPLGMGSGAIRDSQLSASSEWDRNHAPRRGRLNIRRSGRDVGAWCAKRNNLHQWLQVDFGKTKTVTKVATQGRQDTSQWVKKYTVTHSLDGKHWLSYKDLGQEKEFDGNSDRNKIKVHSFYPPIKARFIRINPKSWHGHISMRMELYGCE